jgi:glycosyltransferase involved in cell wall biosynthesis
MKFLIVWFSVYPWEVRIEKLADSLTAQGHQVTVLARRKTEASFDDTLESGVRILRMGKGLPFRLTMPIPVNPAWRAAIKAAIDQVRPDLVIVRDLPVSEITARVARSRGIPVVMDMAEHYPGAMRSWRKYEKNPFSRFLVHRLKTPDWLEKRAVQIMDGVITVCDEQIDRLAEGYGYSRADMCVVNNSPRLNWFGGARKGVSATPRVFGHHGHMTPERGLGILIEAFHEVAKKFPNAELHLAGTGECAAEVASAIQRLGIGKQVKLTGRYSHCDLDRLYGAIDIGVLPYPPNELTNHTLSNKIFDYMACGKPLITSAAAPMKRLIAETGAGMCFQPWTSTALATAMSAALKQDLTPYSERGIKAFREKFNWEADMVQLRDFVDAIVKGVAA